MGCPDNTSPGIGEQNRAAIRRDDAKHHPRRRCHHRIGNGAALGGIVPSLRHGQNVRRMHLMRRSEPASGEDCIGRSGAQGANVSAVPRPAKAELMNAPRAPEKTMRDARQQRRGFDLEVCHLSRPDCG